MATIEFDGQQIPAPELGFASEATLRRLAGMGGQSSGSIGNLGKSSNTTARSLDDLRRKVDELEDKFPKVTAGFDLLGGAIMSTTGLLKGVMNASGKFSDLNPVIDIATASMQNLAGLAPFVGGFLQGVIGATGELYKFKLEIMDLTLDTFSSLQDLGIQFNTQVGTTDDLIQEIIKAQITLGSFNEVVGQNLEGIVAFGGATDTGARKFLRQLDQLTDPLSETGMQLRSLGLDSDAIAEAFGDFIQTNRFNARMMTMEETQLREQLVQRIKNERLITELTGLDVKEQRARLNQTAQEASLQAALMDMDADAAEQTMKFASLLDGPIRDAFVGFTTPFGVANEEALKLIGFVPEVGTTLESIQQRLENGSLTALEAQAELNQVLGEASKNQRVQNLLLIDAARGTNEFSGIFGDAFLKGRQFVNQLDLINQGTGQSFKTQDEAAQYFLDQVGVSANEFENAMRKIKTVLTAEDIMQLEEMAPQDRAKFLKNIKGLDTETGNTLAALSAIQDEFFSLSQAKIIQTFAGDVQGFATLLGKTYDTLQEKLNLKGVDTIDVKAENMKVELNGNTIEIAPGSAAYATMNQIYQERQANSPFTNNFSGGNLFPGMLSMVGEMGPELIKAGGTGEVINNATSSDIMSAANAVVNNLGNNSSGYAKATLDVLTAMAKDQADTKRLLTRILPKAMTGNGYF